MKKIFQHLSLIACVTLLATGCSTRLELTNDDDYSNRLFDYSQEGLCVGIKIDNPSYEADIIGQGLTKALREQAEYRTFYQHIILDRLDVVANVQIDYDFSGSFSNFLVAFPGYIFFTHSWLGYKYYASYNVKCDLTAVVTNELIATIEIPVEVGFRHAEFDRAWLNCFIWPVAPLAPLNGLYCITYDDDITREFRGEFYGTLSGHIATEIIKVLNNQDWGTSEEVYGDE